MRSVLLVAIVAVVGLVAWWSMHGDDAVVPSPSPSPHATGPNGAGNPADPTTGRLATTPTQPDVPTTSPDTPKVTTPTPDAPAPSTPNVELRVRDLAARTAVPTFRWRFQNSLGTHKGDGTNGVAACVLPDSAVGELLVEADGLQPFTRSLVVPTPPAPLLVVDVFLGPAAPATGITLHVRDTSLQPIAWVRVDAFAITDDNRHLAWQLGNPRWARRTGAADGKYTLPPLAPGEYGIRIVATDEQGELLPLLPFRRVYALTGSNGFDEDVPLEPGALLTLDLVHGNEPLDPARHGKTTLSLRLPGGPAVERRWVVRADNVEAGAIDVLAGPGRVHLADAIPAGQYQLEVFVGGQPRVQQMLFLKPGQKNEERILVP